MDPLTWQNGLPTRAGVYWIEQRTPLRDGGARTDVRVAEVDEYGSGHLIVTYCGVETEDYLEQANIVRFAGPIQLPDGSVSQ